MTNTEPEYYWGPSYQAYQGPWGWRYETTSYAVSADISEEVLKALADAKVGDVVPIPATKEPARIIYMGHEAFRIYREVAIEQSGMFLERPGAFFMGIPVIGSGNLRPFDVLCADLHLQNELGDIIKAKLSMIANSNPFAGGRIAPQATSIYRLEEPNRLWRMAAIGILIAWIALSLYAWQIGLLIFGR